MPQNRYFYYDHEACTFVEVQPGRARWIARSAVAAALVVAFAAAGTLYFSDAVDTPHELAQREEIDALRTELASANTRLTAFSDEIADLARTDRELYRTVLNAEPISEDEFQMGVGGAADHRFDRYSAPSAQLLRRSTETLDRLERQIRLQTRSYEDLMRLAQDREEELSEQPAILPIRGGRLT